MGSFYLCIQEYILLYIIINEKVAINLKEKKARKEGYMKEFGGRREKT